MVSGLLFNHSMLNGMLHNQEQRVYEPILKNKDIKSLNQNLKSLITHKFYSNNVITKSNNNLQYGTKEFIFPNSSKRFN